MGFVRKHKRALITFLSLFCLLLMVITTMYSLNKRLLGDIFGFVVTPVQGFFTYCGNQVSGGIDFLKEMRRLADENAELRAENADLRAENVRLNIVEQDNDKLTGLLEIAQKYADYPKLGASIIAREPGNWYNVYYINKGAADGLERNMIVLAAGGLAGRVVDVYNTYAKVVSLIDDEGGISAKSERTGDSGFVRGDTFLMTEGKCRMEKIIPEADIAVGDNIVTDQLSTIYPPGILIGEVIEVSRDTLGYQTAVLRPYVNFRHMETVLVVTELFVTELYDGS